MAKLWYATTNPGKVASLQQHLSPAGIEVVQRALSIPEPRLDSVERTAIFKAMFAFQELKEPVVALDAGFFIHGLRGFPGTYVNFALETVDIDGMLRLAVGTDRRCEFRHSLAVDFGSKDMPIAFSDVVRGTITPEPCGVFDRTYHWSKLVTVFVPDGQTKTLGEMSYDKYQRWSEHHDAGHRYYDHFLNWYRHLVPVMGDSD